MGGRPERISSSSPERPRSLKRLSQKRTVAPHSPILAAIPGALRPSAACCMICARRTSPAPNVRERTMRASSAASSSPKARTRSVIATSPAWTRAPCNAPNPEKLYPTCRMHHLVRAGDLIGQLGDPFYPRKLNALYYEFVEIGVHEKLGYNTPADMV